MPPPIQDQFIDDEEEEELCPLCVEEMDLTDKNFRPCPCGYQICQFCYNNIKTTMNGLCPACRRKYEDKNIQYKAVSPEEMAQHRQNVAQQQKKKAAAKQKEAQKREADHLSRKHLAGLRVRQKNLVYVTGLRPKATGDKLVEGLRTKEHFGQYGDIVKIVVSKSKDVTPSPNQPVAIYITYIRKEDAASCIESIDGFRQPDGTKLRAQYGTTKYCSAYLRGDTCTNKSCMFLHEPGEDSESFTRQDLSSLNAYNSQQQQYSITGVAQSPQPQPPAPQSLPVAAAVQDYEHAVYSAAASPRDGPALPATANWGDQARRASRATASSTNSPLVTTVSAVKPIVKEEPKVEPQPEVEQKPEPSRKAQKLRYPYFEDLPKFAFDPNLKFVFAFPPNFTASDIWIVENMPPLFDPNEGHRRRLLKEREAEETRRQQSESLSEHNISESIIDIEEPIDMGPGGSSQLGGEPEEHPDRTFGQRSLVSPQAIGGSPLNLGQPFGLGDDLLGNRPLGAQQTQQQSSLLQQLKLSGNNSQNSQQQGHGRQPSRFFESAPKSFGKPGGVLGQSQFTQNQSPGNAFHFSSVQGPPPGLKTTGTPPVSGGGMFAQGHGFTQGVGYGNRDSDKLWDMNRGRGNVGGESGKRELMFPSYHQHPSSTTPTPSALGFPYGGPPGAMYPDTGISQKQKKKGKKHRHANTSSSGGGVVDVADPSILQMRVGGSMAGQSGYGVGQGQAGGFPSALHGNAYRGGW